MTQTIHPPAKADLAPLPLGELFLGFLSVGLRGFGGVLPWAHQMMVEERRWLTEAEWTEMLSVGQLLPGPNIVNISVILGTRQHGLIGAIVCVSALMLAPLVIVLSLGALYERYGQLPAIDPVLHNLGAAAAGLILATGLKMSRGRWAQPRSVAIGAAAFAAVGLAHLPLLAVVLVLAPLSVVVHRQRTVRP